MSAAVIKRPWFQFSLKGLFVGFTVICVALAAGRYYYERHLVPETPIRWRAYRPGLIEELRAEGRPVLIHFTIRGVMAGVTLQRVLFNSPEVRLEVHRGGYEPILVDCSRGAGKE